VFQVDVLVCPCGGRRKIIAYIVERKVVKSILERPGVALHCAADAPGEKRGRG
jgi:hypothetical protein